MLVVEATLSRQIVECGGVFASVPMRPIRHYLIRLYVLPPPTTFVMVGELWAASLLYQSQGFSSSDRA